MKIRQWAFILLLLHSLPAPAEVSRATLGELNGITAAFRCSGALLDLGRGNNERALVLSAGHCPSPSSSYPPQTADINRTLKTHDEGVVTYVPSIDPAANLAPPPGFRNYWVNSVVYATMSVTDVSVFEIENTIGELKALGFRFFKLATRLPVPGQHLKVTSGLRGATQDCTVSQLIESNAVEARIFRHVAAFAPLRNSILMDRGCAVKGGWSGSPLVDADTGLIYGVASRMRSREPDDQATEETAEMIGSNVVDLKACFAPNGALALTQPGCSLPQTLAY